MIRDRVIKSAGREGLPCKIVGDGFRRLDELVIHDTARMKVDQADSRELFAILCHALSKLSMCRVLYDLAVEKTHHFAVNGVYLLSLQIGSRLGVWLWRFYPPFRLLEDIRHVRRYRILVLNHLLKCEKILRRVAF